MPPRAVYLRGSKGLRDCFTLCSKRYIIRSYANLFRYQPGGVGPGRWRSDMERTGELKATAKAAGADLVGVADLGPFKAGETLLPPHALERFTKAVSVAVHLDDAIVDNIKQAPTPALHAALPRSQRHLESPHGPACRMDHGTRSFGVRHTSLSIVDESNQLGSISHKAVARLAGIGWQGKSLLIVSPQYGPRIRLATILTDMPLSSDKPVKNRCGTCDDAPRRVLHLP